MRIAAGFVNEYVSNLGKVFNKARKIRVCISNMIVDKSYSVDRRGIGINKSRVRQFDILRDNKDKKYNGTLIFMIIMIDNDQNKL